MEDTDPTCAVMLLQVSVQAADVKSVIQVYSIEVAARDVSDLDEEPIVVRLRKASTSSTSTKLTLGYTLRSLIDRLSLSLSLSRREEPATTAYELITY